MDGIGTNDSSEDRFYVAGGLHLQPPVVGSRESLLGHRKSAVEWVRLEKNDYFTWWQINVGGGKSRLLDT